MSEKSIVGYGSRNRLTEARVARIDETFTLPELAIAIRVNELQVTWPFPSPGWSLYRAASVEASASWTRVPGPYDQQARTLFFAEPLPGQTSFFRLIRDSQ